MSLSHRLILIFIGTKFNVKQRKRITMENQIDPLNVYTLAKDLANSFLVKNYDVDSAAEYMLKNYYDYSFTVKVIGYMRRES